MNGYDGCIEHVKVLAQDRWYHKLGTISDNFARLMHEYLLNDSIYCAQLMIQSWKDLNGICQAYSIQCWYIGSINKNS